MLELIIGVLVAFAAIALVLEPLVRPLPVAHGGGDADADEAELVDVRDVDSAKVQALIALREVEFDRATGKLSETDYARLKARYEAEALAAINAEESAPTWPVAAPGTPAGRAVCPKCGPRPETAPIFCSGCGRSLVEVAQGTRCWHCGAGLADDAKFCAECGSSVTAKV